MKDGYGNEIVLGEQLRDVTIEQITKLRGNADVLQNDRQLSLQAWVKLGIEIEQLAQGKEVKTADLPAPGDKQTKD
jgi:hypothetical protein